MFRPAFRRDNACGREERLNMLARLPHRFVISGLPLFLCSLLLIGCDPHILLDSNSAAIQYYNNPSCFLLIGRVPVGAESYWKSPNCSRSSKNTPVYSISVNDSIDYLSQYGVPIDSVFSIAENDTSYTVNRLYAVMIDGPKREPGCNYLIRLFNHDGDKSLYYDVTRYIDFFTINGIIKKVVIHFWAS